MEEYLPYFTYEKDEKIEDCFYLLKDVQIDFDSDLAKLTIQSIENQFNYSDSKYREYLKSIGLEFKYILRDDQTNWYELIINDAAKEYVRKAVLNIASIDGHYEPLVIVLADGNIYGNVDAFDSLDKEGKELLNTLISKKIIKKKTIKLNQETIPLKEIQDIG